MRIQGTEKDIERLQDNLYVIRRIAGWSAEDLGDCIGVTKQTIRNLEKRNNNARMSKTQYIAIRTVLDYEVQEHPEKTVLKRVMELLLDTEDVPEDVYKNIQDAVTLASNGIAGGMSNETIITMLKTLLGSVAFGAGVVSGISWIARVLK